MRIKTNMRDYLIVAFLLGASALLSRAANGQEPIGSLILKGTHNSYQCHGDPPNMGHLVNVQMDDFGVWGIELDIGFIRQADGQIVAVIGHDGPGDGVCVNIQNFYPELNPNAFEGYLRLIKSAQSFRYRPVVLFFDWKTRDKGEWSDILCPVSCYAFGRSAAEAVFGRENVLDGNVADTKSVPELAGKVILGLSERNTGDCTNRQGVLDWFRGNSGLNFFRIDQYQSDWTFDIGVPPNPLVVDRSAPAEKTVTDSIGEPWFCVTDFFPGTSNCSIGEVPAACDVSNGQVVHSQGTYRFPYQTLTSAIQRAQGRTPTGKASLLSHRTGFGWTVLMAPGSYPETVSIDFPLTLKKLDGATGTVIIGQR